MQRSIPFLWGLVIIILIINLFLLDTLNLARLTAIETLTTIEASLDNLANEVIVYDIEVNQAVPIKADVPLNQTVEVPINTVIPIDQDVTVPFQMGSGQIEVEMPVQMNFPIDLVVPINLTETIRVDTTVQLNTTVPVEIDIAQTALAGYVKQVRLQIAQLKNRLALKDEAIAIEEIPVVDKSTTPDNNVLPTQPVTGEMGASLSTVGDNQNLETPVEAITDVGGKSQFAAIPETERGLCIHPYWSLLPQTAYIYNSPSTSYRYLVNSIANDEILLSSQYEEQEIQFSIDCYQEGLGGGYLGDMRRLSEFGALYFSNPRGIFLPEPTLMEEIGSTWSQELDVSGSVMATQGQNEISGQITHGRAGSTFTITGQETLETLLGPQEAVRIEQQLQIDLEVNFDSGNRRSPAKMAADLTNIYWFSKGLGLVKTQWQGGTLQRELEVGGEIVKQEFLIPDLPEEELVLICGLSGEEKATCLGGGDFTEANLTTPPEIELEIPAFTFPAESVEGDPAIDSPTTTQDLDHKEDPETPIDLPEDESGSQAALLAYAEAVTVSGQRITELGEAFGEAAISYRNDEITIDEFQDRFLSFEAKVRGPMENIKGLSPPQEAIQIHQTLTGGLEKCEQGIDLMDEWFDTGDSGTKDATALLVASCINEVTAAGDALEELLSENSN